MFPRRRRARADFRPQGAVLLVLALQVSGCGTSTPTATKPKISLASSTAPAAPAPPGFELIDPGVPPRQQLVFELAPGRRYRFSVSRELRLIQDGVAKGSVSLAGPLLVHVNDARGGSFQITLEIGPVSVQQQGDTAGISLPAADAGAASARMTARVRLGARGQALEHHVLENAEEALVLPLLETLLHLDELPRGPVGAGARWRTLRRENGAGARTRSEHELLKLGAHHGTLRVWREQFTADTPSAASRANGDWSWSRDRWPLTGVDRTSFDLPGHEDAVVSVTFRVTDLDQ
jgi:hypothetical protein